MKLYTVSVKGAKNATAWRVVVGKRDSGIVETNLPYALPYWRERANKRKKNVELIGFRPGENPKARSGFIRLNPSLLSLAEAQAIYAGTQRSGRLIDTVRPGDRVTIVNRFGQQRSGRAVMPSSVGGWVLNMGGPHGTPALADDRNIVKVKKRRG